MVKKMLIGLYIVSALIYFAHLIQKEHYTPNYHDKYDFHALSIAGKAIFFPFHMLAEHYDGEKDYKENP